MTPGHKYQPRAARTSIGRRMASGATHRLHPQTYVGIAHIAFGALGLITGTLGILFALSGVAGWLLVGYIGMVALAGLTIVAGLWLHDGHRRGAILAAATDGLRLLLALLVTHPLSLDVLMPAGLLGAIFWLWPTLERLDS